MLKCRGRNKIPTTTNTELLVTLCNSRNPLTNVKKLHLRCCEGPIYAYIFITYIYK